MADIILVIPKVLRPYVIWARGRKAVAISRPDPRWGFGFDQISRTVNKPQFPKGRVIERVFLAWDGKIRGWHQFLRFEHIDTEIANSGGWRFVMSAEHHPLRRPIACTGITRWRYKS